MSTLPADATRRRRLQVGTVGLGVAVAALSVVVVSTPDVLTATTRRAVEATAAAYDTTPGVAFVTLHAPLVFGVLAGAVGSVYVGLLLPGGGTRAPGESAADPASVAAALRFYARNGALATGVALGVPLAVVDDTLPATLVLAFVAGVPLGVLGLCGATVGVAVAGRTGWRAAMLLGTVAPVVGIVLAHAVPTGPVWTASAGATFTGLAAVGGGWSLLDRDES
jgi:hypothetical protein